MAGREARLETFHKSLDNLQVWLEQCQKSVSRFPAELHQFDASQLTKLALKYKELLIQLKEKYFYIHEMKSFYGDLEKEAAVHGLAKSDRFFARDSANGVKSSQPSERIQQVDLLWTDACKEVKHQYSKLSSALVLLTGRALTPVSSISTPSSTHSRHANKSASPDEQDVEPAHQKVSRTELAEAGVQPDEESLDSLLSSLQQEVNQQVKSLEQFLANDDDLSSGKPVPPHVTSKSVSKNTPSVDMASLGADRGLSHRSKSVSQRRALSHKPLANNFSSSPKPSQQNTDPDDAMKELDDFINSLSSSPAKQGNSSYRARSATSDKANCRLARKLRGISPKLREAEKSLGSNIACPLQVAAIERRLTDYKMSMSIVEEQARHIGGIQAPCGQQPIYTPLEWECCQETMSSVQAKVQGLNSTLDDVISRYELVLELIQQFENEASDCHDMLSTSGSDVSELRNSVLEGCLSNQPWTSATKALDSLKSSSEKVSLLEKLSKQLLSLEPQFDGTAVRQQMSSLTTELHQLHSEANSTVQNAISHRIKFAEEHVAIVDDWLLRVRALVESWVKGEEECTAESRQAVAHEVSDHQSTFGLILEQLQHFQELSSQPDVLKKAHDRIIQQQEKLEKLLKQLKGSSHILRIRHKSAGSTPDPMEQSSPSRKISPTVSQSAHISDSQRSRKTSQDNTIKSSPAPVSPSLHTAATTTSSEPLSPPPKSVHSPKPPGAKHSRDASTSSSEGSSSSGTHQKEAPIFESSPQTIALLQFIDAEYSFTTEKLGVEDVGIISTEEVGEALKKFWSALLNLNSTMEAIQDQIYYIGIPTDPSQQNFKETLQLCKAIKRQLDCSNVLLSKYHDDSLQLATASSEDQPQHRVVLLTECQLFKLSTVYHKCHLLLREKGQVLHQAQEDYGSLYDDLKELSGCLEESNKLLVHRDELLDVGQFLLECKEAHLRMARFSNRRQQASSKIRNLLLVSTTSKSKNPPSPSQASRRPSVSSLMLLEQLRSIEMQWVNVINELANMVQLEPLLFKRMLRNVAKELKTLEGFSLEIQYEGMDLEILVKKAKLCKDKLKKLRILQVSLKQATRRLTHLKDLPEDEPVYDHPRSILSPLPVAVENGSKFELPPPSQSPPANPVHAVHNGGSTSLTTSGVHDSSLPKDDKTQGSIIPKQKTDVGMIRCDSLVNYPQLLKMCKALLDMIEKFISNIEMWYNRFDEWRRTMDVFWSESNGLRTWMRATSKALVGKDSKISSVLTEEITTRRQALVDLHQHTTHVLALPSTAQERDTIKDVISKLDAKWESLCLSLPVGMRLNATITVDPISHLRPPAAFEDVVQMMEWLILVESKLQPHPLVVGDTTKLRTLLDEISAVNKELTLKTSEYHQFMRAGMKGESFDYTDPGSPQKAVKFYDEDTIDRQQRRKEISEDRLIDTLLQDDGGEDDRKHKGSVSSKGSPVRTNKPPNLTIKTPPSSASVLPSVFSPSSEEAQQLSLLWNGIWSMLSQRKQGLESVLDIWSGFDSKRKSFEHFVGLIETRMPKVFSKLKSPTSIAHLNASIEELKTFGEEVAQHQQKLGSLNDLTSDLIHRYRNTDNTEELQKSMTKLNVRWKKVHESFLKKKSSIEVLSRRWDKFFQAYQTLHSWMEERDACLTAINPLVNDFALIHKAVETVKIIQRELAFHSDALTNINFHLSKLQADSSIGGSVVNIGFVNRTVELMGRQLQQIGQLAQERLTALEKSHFERKEVVSVVTRCQVWTKRAEEHMASVRPVTAEAAKIVAQLDMHKEFESELKERQLQIELALAKAKHMTSDFMNPQAISASKDSEELKLHFTGTQDRLAELSKESESWRRELESVKTIMDEFQVLSNQLSQKLSEWQEKLLPHEPVASTLNMLKHQSEHWRQCETGIGALGKMLESMVSSQRKLVDMGAQISIDVVQLVKRYHKQWSEAKKFIVSYVMDIKEAMERLDPEGIRSALPRGWSKATTPTGSPYYINTLGGNQTQWQHPELAAIYHRSSIKFQHPYYPTSTYLISLRLRALQKDIQLDWLPTEIALKTFEEYKLHLNPNRSLSHTQMTEIALSMFHRAAIISQGTNDLPDKPIPGGLNVHRAVELSVAWVHHVYDLTRTGTVAALSFQTAIVCLSASKMEEKHKALFEVISRGQGTVCMEELISFMETFIQIPQSMTDSQYCSLNALETHVKECFQKYATGSHLHPIGYLAWTQGEPLPIAWLPILHRMTAAETMEHNVKCAVCKMSPIIGFHYKCLQCSNLSLCQECYWSGKTAKDHDRTAHFMEEYCVSNDEKSLRFRSLGSRTTRKRSPRMQHTTDPPMTALNIEESSLPQDPCNSNHITARRKQLMTDSPFKNAVTRSPGGSSGSDLDTTPGGKDDGPLLGGSTTTKRSPNLPRLPIKHPHAATDQSDLSGVGSAPPTMPPRKPIRNKVLLSPTGLQGFLLPSGPKSPPAGGVADTKASERQEQSPIQLMHSNVKLRERVERLESHNKQLEDYISQLRSIAQKDDEGGANSGDQLF